MSGQKGTILHIDATGSVARKPEDFDCKRIFYYCILARHDNTIIKLTHMVTSEHTTASIGNWLSNWQFFVMKANKWPLSKIIVTDKAWAITSQFQSYTAPRIDTRQDMLCAFFAQHRKND